MQAFSQLLERLYFTSSKRSKTALLHDYWRTTEDPDRGWAVAAIAGRLKFKGFKRGLVRDLVRTRVDPVLYDLCYDYVGETAETVSHLWPAAQRPSDPTSAVALHTVIDNLSKLQGATLQAYVADLLDAATAHQRWALIKLATGGLRVGISQRFLRQALADYGNIDIAEVEVIWHSLAPPYEILFAWLEGKAERPQVRAGPTFHPVMLAHPLPPHRLAEINSQHFAAEWKYDGVRVQLVVTREGVDLFSRTGDSMGRAFPEVLQAVHRPVVLDAELVVKPNGAWGTFADLQQRLNRKQVAARWLQDYPAHLIVYDILREDETALTHLPLGSRRQHLERWYRAQEGNALLSLSPWVDFKTVDDLQLLRDACGRSGKVHVEGFMFKRLDSAYVAGRPMGQWYKWKRNPFLIDTVMLYAQRGHGKRSSLYSDFTFGLWHEDAVLPVGKSYFGFTDDELLKLDKWVRDHTTSRFGPVREVELGLVLEIAFDAVQASPRHKSGVAMRFPRVHRIRWDKPYEEADTLQTLRALIVEQASPAPSAQLELFE